MEQDFRLHLNEKTSIDGYNKMHRGTDFAPMGTPIMASGDGIIKKAGCVVVEETV